MSDKTTTSEFSIVKSDMRERPDEKIFQENDSLKNVDSPWYQFFV